MKTKSLLTIIAILFLLVVPLAHSFDDWDDGWDDGWADDFDDDWADDFDEDWADDFDEGWADDFDDGWPDDFDDGWADDFDDDWPDDFDGDEPEDDWDDDGDDDWDDDGDDPVWPDYELNVIDVDGFSSLDVGEEQTIEVQVEDQDHQNVAGVIVTIYYTTGYIYGTCVTDSEGECEFSQEMNTAGTYSVFATAFKYGYIPDADSIPLFTFEVLEEEIDDNNAPYFVTDPITTADKDEKYRYDADAIDPDGDDYYYSLVDGPAGLKISEANGLVTWTPTSNGQFYVSIRVTDEHGAFDEQDFNINVGEGGSSFRLGDLIISKLRVASDEYLAPGSELILSMNLENTGNKNLEDIKITASVQELSTRKSTGYLTLKKHDQKSKTLIVEIPNDAEAGEYGIRVEVYNGDLKRVIYRDFFVE